MNGTPAQTKNLCFLLLLFWDSPFCHITKKYMKKYYNQAWETDQIWHFYLYCYEEKKRHIKELAFIVSPSQHIYFICRLFKEQPELYQLYKELVVSGIITAQEFWENHKKVRKQRRYFFTVNFTKHFAIICSFLPSSLRLVP